MRLKRENGVVIELRLEQLSPADQTVAKSLQEKKLAEEKNTGKAEDKNPFDNAVKREPLSIQEITRNVEHQIVFVASRDQWGAKSTRWEADSSSTARAWLPRTITS